MRFRLGDLSGSLRLTIGAFTVLILSFALLAQRNLWEQAGAGSMPKPQQVLERYFGAPDRTLLHVVLDPTLPEDDDQAMYPYLGDTEAVRAARREQVLAWATRGAPESEWEAVAPIFRGEDTCAQCHVEGGVASHLPLETYAQVSAVATGPSGMSLSALLISAHNHMYAFAVLALLLSLGLCASRVSGVIRVLLILAAFVGPLLDIGGWFLTRAYGDPFHWLVMAGGGLFGFATTVMALAILRDVCCGSPAAEATSP